MSFYSDTENVNPTKNISDLINQQLPSFIRDEADDFSEFLQKYYEWMESHELIINDSVQNEFVIKLDDISVHMTLDHTNIVELTDKIKIIMKYPVMNDMKGINLSGGLEGAFGLISKCVHEIHDGDTIHSRVDMNDKELDEFIDTFSSKQFEQMMDFFNTMPKLRHAIQVTNPKTKKKGEVMLEGLQSFLG